MVRQSNLGGFPHEELSKGFPDLSELSVEVSSVVDAREGGFPQGSNSRHRAWGIGKNKQSIFQNTILTRKSK